MRSDFSILAKIAATAAGFLLLALPAVCAQDAKPKADHKKPVAVPESMGETKKPERKIILSDPIAESPQESTRKAASEKTRPVADKNDKGTPDATADSVLEFHAASRDEQASTNPDIKPLSKSKKKNIHGEAYGGIVPGATGNRREGGAVGATTKSNKTSVYVQGEKSRSESTPH